jgi:hypothetical protein
MTAFAFRTVFSQVTLKISRKLHCNIRSKSLKRLAGATGLEPATFGVTGRGVSLMKSMGLARKISAITDVSRKSF